MVGGGREGGGGVQGGRRLRASCQQMAGQFEAGGGVTVSPRNTASTATLSFNVGLEGGKVGRQFSKDPHHPRFAHPGLFIPGPGGAAMHSDRSQVSRALLLTFTTF